MVKAAILASSFATAQASHWAVLAAGSSSYSNYRHQADLCHAYQVLIEKGFDADHIITLSYDDVASSSQNPFPGKLFNKPANPGKDVYAGCKIDYRGSACSAQNFVNVLTGAGSGKVLQSNSDDHVFVSFFDHGGPGIIAFPGGTLHKSELQTALQSMHDKTMYKKLTFYMEACESGSMFQGMNIPGVYAVSASNPTESSWGTYCGSDAVVNGKNLNTCLGDLFSVNWMEDSDAQDVSKESLSTQYNTVREKTTKSAVMQWSDTSFTSDMVSDYLGTTGSTFTDATEDTAKSAVSVRQLELSQAYEWYRSAVSSEERLKAGLNLKKILESQISAETAYEKFLDIVYHGDEGRKAVARESKALPENPACEIAARQTFIKYGNFDASSGFAMQFHKYIVHVCADGSADHSINTDDVVAAAKKACTDIVV